MKAKLLIRDEDYVVNPTKLLYGDFIPKFTFPESGKPEYVDGRAGMNYGAFLVEKLANNRAKPILNNLVNYFFSEDMTIRALALQNLKKIAEEYKEE